MTNQQFLDQFYIAYNKVSTNQGPGYKPVEIQALATEAQELLVRTGYTAKSNRLNDGIESTEKRIQDFGELVRNRIITPNAYNSNLNNPNGVFVQLPNVQFDPLNPTTFDVFWFTLSEQCLVNFKDCDTNITSRVNVYEINHAEYAALLSDPFNKPSKKRIWRLRYEGLKHELITDGNYTITGYAVRYLRKPRPIYLDGTLPLINQVSELSDHKHLELLRATVDLAVRASENTVRIQTEPKIIE